MIAPESRLDKSEGIALITDGSANYKDGSGGWAFVAVDAFDGLYTASGYMGNTTISQMELTGPTKGLRWLYKGYGPCEVLVYSDSEYVVLGVNDRTRKRSKNKGFWNLLDECIDLHTSVDFLHLKGHNGNIFNEMADKLAGKSRIEGLNDTDNRSE